MNPTQHMEKSLQKINKESKKLRKSLKRAQKQAMEHLPDWSELDLRELPQRKSLWIAGVAIGLFVAGVGLSIWVTKNKSNGEDISEEEVAQDSVQEDIESSDKSVSETQEEESMSEQASWLGSTQNLVKNLQKSVHRYLQQVSGR